MTEKSRRGGGGVRGGGGDIMYIMKILVKNQPRYKVKW